MFKPIKIIDIELSEPLADIDDLAGYQAIKALVRLHGEPVGYVNIQLADSRCTAQALSQAVVEQCSQGISRCYLQNILAANAHTNGKQAADPPYGTLSDNTDWPLVTVAVCTRDRTTNLTLCLQGLDNLDYPNLERLVIDNAPATDATEQLVQSLFPHVRYVCEPLPGLDRARNRAIREAQGEIIAFTDDDVIVDSAWVTTLVRIFIADPDVMAVTGLVVPYELETEAQLLFEQYGGFGRGFERKWYRANHKRPGQAAREHGGTGKFGTGANMAYRRCIFDRIGYFDPALDVGTVTTGGGDLDMFFRIVKEGYTLVYEPGAIVRHRHRRDYEKLRVQLTNNGTGFYSFLVRNALAYPEERQVFMLLGAWWLWWWNFRRLLISFVRPSYFPRNLILAELWGSFVGLRRYQVSQAMTVKDTSDERLQSGRYARSPVNKPGPQRAATAVRTIDVSQKIYGLDDVTEYEYVRVYATWHEHALGTFDISNYYRPVSALEVQTLIANHLYPKLLELKRARNDFVLPAALETVLAPRHETQVKDTTESSLTSDTRVSVVVATHDRPDDLRRCLHAIASQESLRPVEIVIVDNNPDSGLAPLVVADFPGVVLVNEYRKGLSYARNAGITASTGDIIIATDDDVVMPPYWLERIVAPFAQPEVMIVTGNVFPLELETEAQHLFELYGGLGRGFESFKVDRQWFDSFRFKPVPTWHLGATANAAFRAAIFSNQEIGLMDEALGAGTPTGCSEDTYVFYRVLRAGFTIVYEPSAFVWHRHRRDMKSLRRQIYNYSKGHVAYHLMTLLHDGDWRASTQLVLWLPLIHLWRIRQRLLRRSAYPLLLSLIEIAGNLIGPWALWQSRRRVKRNGHSQPYLPVSQREPARATTSSSSLGDKGENKRGLHVPDHR